MITKFYFLQNKRYQLVFDDASFKYRHHYCGENDPNGVKFTLLGVVRDVNRIFVKFIPTIPKKTQFHPLGNFSQ